MIQFHRFNQEENIAEITRDSIDRKIKSPDDILDLFGDCYVNNCVGMVIHKDVFDESFFDLKTGVAGEILQKFTNYNMKLAVIGDFSNVESKSLRDFIRESNERKFINFVDSLPEAVNAFKNSREQ